VKSALACPDHSRDREGKLEHLLLLDGISMPQLGETNSRLSDDASHHDMLDSSINQKESCPHRAREPRLPHRSAQVATMDSRRVDALSSALGNSVTRKRFFALLSAGGASAIAAIWDRDFSSAKHGSRKKGRRRKARAKGTRRQEGSQQVTSGGSPTHRLETNTCPGDRKQAICHCPEGLGGAQCRITCVATSAGHENDPFDCLCAGSAAGVPACGPERCPAVISDNAHCGGPTIYAGACTTNADCPFSSIPGSICDTETRRCVRATCEGRCEHQETCTARGGDCVCLGLSEESSGRCGQCIQDALPANSRDECCSGDFCQSDRICGLCVPG
jgi:hypothetical protein